VKLYVDKDRTAPSPRRVRIAAALALWAASGSAVTRDEREVTVDGVAEVWRLEWLRPPRPVCQPNDENWFACPCVGFAFGETGELDLVRLRESHEADRLHLTPLFSNSDVPAGATTRAALRRWPVREVDADAFQRANPTGRREFSKRVMERKVVSILQLADFNHDGWPTEFVLQIGTEPCGKRQSILVGVSPKRRTLHAFSSADHPERPLILEAEIWRKLRDAKGPGRAVERTCGDLGSEEQSEVVLRTDASGIHATRETFACDPKTGERGKLVSSETL
jgi:hypothetical protein